MAEENDRYTVFFLFSSFLLYVYIACSLFVLYYWILLNGEEEEETNARRSESEHISI